MANAMAQSVLSQRTISMSSPSGKDRHSPAPSSSGTCQLLPEPCDAIYSRSIQELLMSWCFHYVWTPAAYLCGDPELPFWDARLPDTLADFFLIAVGQ